MTKTETIIFDKSSMLFKMSKDIEIILNLNDYDDKHNVKIPPISIIFLSFNEKDCWNFNLEYIANNYPNYKELIDFLKNYEDCIAYTQLLNYESTFNSFIGVKKVFSIDINRRGINFEELLWKCSNVDYKV